jgi:hypothetical protein
LTIGVFISISSTGILTIIGIWMVWLIKGKKKNILKYLFLLMIAIPVIVYFLYTSIFFQAFIGRMQDGFSTRGRFSGYEHVNNMDLLPVEVVFGHGMNKSLKNSPNLQGFVVPFWYFGLVGVFLLIYIYLFYIFINKKTMRQKIFLLVFVVLNAGTDVVVGPFIILYMSFVLTKDNYVI